MYRQVGNADHLPDSQIHVVDGQTDRLLGTFVNKADGNVFWDDLHKDSYEDNQETFEFTVESESEPAAYLKDMNRIIVPDEDGGYHEFIIEEVERHSDGTTDVRCVASYMEIRKQNVIPPLNREGETLESALLTVLSFTEWELNKVEFRGVRNVFWDEYLDAYRALKFIVEEFGVEIRFRVETSGSRVVRRYVDVMEWIGDYTGKEVVLGKDLTGITRKENTADIVTAIYVVGPEMDDETRMQVFVEDRDALKRWGRNGRHLVGIYEPDLGENEADVTEGELRDLGRNYLNRVINTAVSYEADTISIEHQFGLEHEKVRIGDFVRVKDENFNPPLYLSARVIAIERAISDPTQKVFTLGDYIEYDESQIRRSLNRLKQRVQAKPGRPEVIERIEEEGVRTDGKIDDFRDETQAKIDEAQERIDAAELEIEAAEGRIADAEIRLDNARIELDDLDDRLAVADGRIDSALSEIDDANADISHAQNILDTVTESRDGVHVLRGTLVTDEIIAENATLTGTLTGSNATILNLTTENLTAIDATIDGATITGTLWGNNATIRNVTTRSMTAIDATMENATITGTLTSVDGTFTGNLVAAGGTFTGQLDGVDGTFTGDLVGGSISSNTTLSVSTTATVGNTLNIGQSWQDSGTKSLNFKGGQTGTPRLRVPASTDNLLIQAGLGEIYIESGSNLYLNTSTGSVRANGSIVLTANSSISNSQLPSIITGLTRTTYSFQGSIAGTRTGGTIEYGARNGVIGFYAYMDGVWRELATV